MRDKTIDGYRALAALGVVFAHAVDYRFAAPHFLQRLADPLAQTSVQIFFVISGYIITSLLLRERERTGRISIPAFYIRRVCRIIPPLAAVLAVVALVGVDGSSLAMASTFTCNIGNCQWPVAHTWSLSVEEQFYLAWPMLLVTFTPRPSVIITAIGALLLTFLVQPFAWHSNYISFACIGAGALYASTRWAMPASRPVWFVTAAFLILAPLYLPLKAAAITPFLIVYLLFGTPAFVKRILAIRPVQILGLSSYSIYLWQQLFLGKTHLPLWGLPLVVAVSVLLVEQPFTRLGRKLTDAYAYEPYLGHRKRV